MQGHFPPAKAAARTAALAVLDSERYFALLDQLDRLLADPPFGPDADKRASSRGQSGAARLPEDRPPDAPGLARRTGPAAGRGLHEARKAAKRARYAGEAAAPALGNQPGGSPSGSSRSRPYSVIIRTRSSPARRSGSWASARTWLGRTAFTYGLLYADDAHEAEQLQARARRAWKRASRRALPGVAGLGGERRRAAPPESPGRPAASSGLTPSLACDGAAAGT